MIKTKASILIYSGIENPTIDLSDDESESIQELALTLSEPAAEPRFNLGFSGFAVFWDWEDKEKTIPCFITKGNTVVIYIRIPNSPTDECVKESYKDTVGLVELIKGKLLTTFPDYSEACNE